MGGLPFQLMNKAALRSRSHQKSNLNDLTFQHFHTVKIFNKMRLIKET